MLRERAASGGWLGLATLRRLGGGDSLVHVAPGGQPLPNPKRAGASLGHLSSRHQGCRASEGLADGQGGRGKARRGGLIGL